MPTCCCRTSIRFNIEASSVNQTIGNQPVNGNDPLSNDSSLPQSQLPQSKFNVFKTISRYSLIRRPGSLTTSCSLRLMPAKYSLTSVSHPLLTCTSDSFQAFDHCSSLLGPLRHNLFSCLTCQNHHLNPTVPPGFAIPTLSPIMANTLLSNCSLGETSLATVEQRECHLPLRAHYALILSPASKVPCTLKQQPRAISTTRIPKTGSVAGGNSTIRTKKKVLYFSAWAFPTRKMVDVERIGGTQNAF